MSPKSARPSRSSSRSSTASQGAAARGGASGRPARGSKSGGGGRGRGDNKTMIIVIAAVAVLALGGLAVALGGGGSDNVRSRPRRVAPREVVEDSRPASRPLRKLTSRKEIDDNLVAAKRRLTAANQAGSNAARNRERQEVVFLCDEVLQCALSTDGDKKNAQKMKYEAKKTMTR